MTSAGSTDFDSAQSANRRDEVLRPTEAAVDSRSSDLGGANESGSLGRAPAAVWVLTAAFALVITVWCILTPQLNAPDEGEHFSSAVRLAVSLDWPAPGEARFPGAVEAVVGETALPHDQRSTLEELLIAHPGTSERLDQMTQHPPLYYLVAGAILRLPFVQGLVWDQALLVVRLLGVVFGAPLIWLAWSTVGSLLRSRRGGTLAAVSVFLVPGLTQTLGVVTNDSLAILCAWVTTWLAVKILCGDRRRRVTIGIGIAFGLGALVKATVVPLGILVVLAILFGRGQPARWRDRIVAVIWPLAIAFVIGLWWWPKNLLVYGRLQPHGLLLDFPEWAPGTRPSLGHYIDEIWRLTPGTFWGWFGRVAVPLPELVVDVLTVGAVVLLGLGLFAKRRWLRESLILASPVVAVVVLFLMESWQSYEDTTVPRGLHGRYFYTVLLVLVALIAIATHNLIVGSTNRRVFAVVIASASVAMGVGGPVVAFLGFYAGNNYGRSLAGVRTWFAFYSPVPGWLTLGVIAAYGVSLAVGFTLVIIQMMRRNTREWSNQLEMA